MNRVKFNRFAAVALSLACLTCGGGETSNSASPTVPQLDLPAGTILTSPTACGSLVSPGSFVLANDLSSTAQPCLIISTDNVRLDCGGHSIANGISINKHNNITISGCTVRGYGISVRSGSRVVLDHNVLFGSIVLSGGAQNQITQNMIDGGDHGHNTTGQGGDAPGEDDGIVLSNEADDVVEGNTIANVFDAGIEGVNAVTNTVIANNTIADAVLAGISSYHCTHWVGNAVNGNRVSRTQFLIYVRDDVDALCSQPATNGAFVDNQITNNVFRSPLGELGARIDFSKFSAPAPVVSNNLIRGNDFVLPLRLVPTEGFVNGGGNTCQQGGDFVCGSSVSRLFGRMLRTPTRR